MAITFEGYERRIDKINKVLAEYGINGLEDAQKICKDKGINVEEIVKGIQPIAFDNAVWAYTAGAAIAIKKGSKNAAEAAEYRDWLAVVLHTRFCRRLPRCWARARQSWRDAFEGRNKVLLLPRRPRILCGCRGRDRHCQNRQ